MTARIIWIGKNNSMVVTPRSASSAGVTAAARPVVLPREGRAAPSLQPRDPSLRGNWRVSSLERAPLFDLPWVLPTPPDDTAGLSGSSPLRFARTQGAFTYDATAERWIVPPSTVTVDAGAAADLQHSVRETRRFPTLPSPAASPNSRRAFWAEVAEFLTVALGLTVFGMIAGFFLVMHQ